VIKSKRKLKNEMKKMKRTKLMTSVMTVAAICLILVLFSTSVQAAGTTKRPIEQWEGEEIAGWADPVSGLVIHPHAVEWCLEGPSWPFNFLDWEHLSLFECESYHGFIKEKTLDDETTLITIQVTVKGVPFMIFAGGEGYNYNLPLYYGYMHYTLQVRILFNTESLYSILDQFGKIPPLYLIFAGADPIAKPFFWDVAYPGEPVPLVTFIHFVGNGYLTQGGEGNVHVNQLGIWDSEIFDFNWPMEQVTIS
jgi:hypothetical protein